MSSLRNAVQRRNHRERAQPLEREKWGLLEKRKDYKLRANDHKVKKRKINALKQKASERNEDEFYFGMMSSTTDGGIKRSKRFEDNSGGGGKSLKHDVVMLMKTQDEGYLRTMLQRTQNEISRLREEVIMATRGVAEKKNSNRIKFGDDNDEEMNNTLAEYDAADMASEDGDFDGDLPDLDSDVESGPDEEMNDLAELPLEERRRQQRKQHHLEVRRRKLEALREQEQSLSAALDGVNAQRARMNNSGSGVNKAGVKFKQRERKR